MNKKTATYLNFLEKQPPGFVHSGDNENKPNPTTKTKTSPQAKLDALKKKYASCAGCPLASQGRTNVVFGHGNPEASLMFVGEGPGRDEDIQAKPFVGRSGQLLTKIIEAMGLSREEVYISNIVKCRPPNNRAPLPNESGTCKNNILFQEIEIIQPRIICTLGATATQELLEKPMSISRVRGTFIPFKDRLVLPTFHPAYLLRNQSKKKEVWEDMKKIMEALKLP